MPDHKALQTLVILYNVQSLVKLTPSNTELSTQITFRQTVAGSGLQLSDRERDNEGDKRKEVQQKGKTNKNLEFWQTRNESNEAQTGQHCAVHQTCSDSGYNHLIKSC